MKRTADAKLNHHPFTTGLPIRLHLRHDLHLLRKAWHMIMGLVMAMIYMAGMERSTAVIILASVLGLDLFLETARLRIPSLNEKLIRVWGPLMRSCEVNKMSGVPFYLASAVLAVAIFPKPIAVLSILYLAFGDPIASLFGILYGKKSIQIAKGKSLIGTMAGVITCALVTFTFLQIFTLSDELVFLLTAIGGIAGGTAELVPFDMDDNFTIPIVSGFVMWLAFIIIGV